LHDRDSEGAMRGGYSRAADIGGDQQLCEYDPSMSCLGGRGTSGVQSAILNPQC